MSYTKKDHVQYLNEFSPSYESCEWIMGGKRRSKYAAQGRYGDCMKLHDPIAFEVSYQERRREHG